jgi:hypothetical protein
VSNPDVRAEFATHNLNESGRTKAVSIARAFDTCLARLEELAGADGREMALVRTKLEEASFFAKKAMAKRTENQEAP